MTYSIVAFDAATTQWGVAVASKAMCVGAHVPWGAGAVGAVATQAFHDLRYGYEGLAALRAGDSADGVVETLTADDPESVFRQLGVVDAAGRAATFTGPQCMPWAGGIAGDGWAAQGNILAGPQVVEAMARPMYRRRRRPTARSPNAWWPPCSPGTRPAATGAGASRRRSRCGRCRVTSPAGVRDLALFLRVDDAVLPVHDLQRLVGRVAADETLLLPTS